MRLFAALIPPQEAVADLERFVVSRRAAARVDVRWSPAEQWHLTLAFLASVHPDRADDLASALERVAATTPPLELAIAGAGAFPRADRARVVWAGLTGATDAVGELARHCQDAAAELGLDVAGGPFHPHLTLARARRRAVGVGPLLDAIGTYDGPPWTASELVLVQSQLGKGEGGRSRHVALATLPLCGGRR